jgi:uncharacterized protein involved in exopolysaccharide biosynthesis
MIDAAPGARDCGPDTLTGTRSEDVVFQQGAGPAALVAPEPELTLGAVVRVLRENWKPISAFAAVGILIGVASVLLTARVYTATVSFFPESRRADGPLAMLTQQYGLNLPGAVGTGGPSLPFYVELVRSRALLGQVLTDTVKYVVAGTTVSEPLIDFLDLEGETHAERLEEGVIELRRKVRPLSNPNTGIVRIDVTTRSPHVSQAIAARMLELVNEFNLHTRQSQGASERLFAERRLAEHTDSLRAAERRLEAFEAANPQYAVSPHLRMTHLRLRNDLTAKQTLHTAVAQSYEQARMDEVRDTPLITPLERATVPVRPDSRRGVQKLMFGTILGLVVGTALAFARSSTRVEAR